MSIYSDKPTVRGGSALLLTHTAAVGGASRSLASIIKVLAASGVTITVASPPGPMTATYRHLGAEIIEWRPPALYWAFGAVYSSGVVGLSLGYLLALIRLPMDLVRSKRQIRREIRDREITVVHVNTLVLFPLVRQLRGLRERHQVRVIWHVREPLNPRLNRLLRRRISCGIADASDVVLAISPAVAASLSPEVDATLLYNQVGVEWLRADNPTNVATRSVVVMASAFLAGKGIPDFVKMARQLAPEFPHVRFRLFLTSPVMGGRTASLALRLLLRVSPTVRTLRDSAWAFKHAVIDDQIEVVFDRVLGRDDYVGCLVFVNPDELGVTWGRTILEAMCLGIPVVACGSAEDVVVQGETGFLVPPRDPTLLADRVRLLLQDDHLRGEMSARAIERSRLLGEGFSGQVRAAFGISHSEEPGS